jgi:hypothetical protein
MAGALLVVLAGRQPTLVPRTNTPGECPKPLTRSPLSETRLLASETTLFALEYENGCIDHAEVAPQPVNWAALGVTFGCPNSNIHTEEQL